MYHVSTQNIDEHMINVHYYYYYYYHPEYKCKVDNKITDCVPLSNSQKDIQ